MLVAVAELFKMLLGKDDDKELGERIIGDYLDSTIGMFPILKDGYSILQGHDISNIRNVIRITAHRHSFGKSYVSARQG